MEADWGSQARGKRIMQQDHAAITWSEGMAAFLTLGIITFLLFV